VNRILTCRDLDPLIEPLAAGDLAADADMAAHVAACAR